MVEKRSASRRADDNRLFNARKEREKEWSALIYARRLSTVFYYFGIAASIAVLILTWQQRKITKRFNEIVEKTAPIMAIHDGLAKDHANGR